MPPRPCLSLSLTYLVTVFLLKNVCLICLKGQIRAESGRRSAELLHACVYGWFHACVHVPFFLIYGAAVPLILEPVVRRSLLLFFFFFWSRGLSELDGLLLVGRFYQCMYSYFLVGKVIY